ncbi:neutral ceramidase 3 [Trichonephila clavipes]|nr:neutral ceramidase 3 [Trichonephila clavipes]
MRADVGLDMSWICWIWAMSHPLPLLFRVEQSTLTSHPSRNVRLKDTWEMTQTDVVKALKEKWGDLYTEENVLLTATHTHAAPGGYLQYLLYLIPSQGFIRQTFFSLVKGIVKSVERAHESIRPGYIYWNEGEVHNTSINRSPTAYENNPEEERNR